MRSRLFFLTMLILIAIGACVQPIVPPQDPTYPFEYGSVVVSSNVETAVLYVGVDRIGAIGESRTVELAEGTYALTLAAPGYITGFETVTISAGETIELAVPLVEHAYESSLIVAPDPGLIYPDNGITGAVISTENLVVNGGFELDATGWSRTGPVRFVPTAYEGSQSMYAFKPHRGPFQTVDLSPGTYVLRAVVRSADVSGFGAWASFVMTSASDGSTRSWSTPVVSGTSPWTIVEKEFVIPSSFEKGQVELGFDLGGGQVWFDSVRLVRVDQYVEPAVCGDGVVDSGEECDLGLSNGAVCDPAYGSSCSYCSASCEIVTVTGGSCGDGVCDAAESSASCSADCGPATFCGDGVIQEPNDNGIFEQCDHGSSNTDVACSPAYNQSCVYCTTMCEIELVSGGSCGDGVCDAAESSATCNSDCGPATFCGDGAVQRPNDNGLFEQCDYGSENQDACTPAPGETCTVCTTSCVAETFTSEVPPNTFLASYYTGVFDDLVTTRLESTINHDWGTNAPLSGMSADNFSVIWEGVFSFEEGNYTFFIETDDGMRLYLNDDLVVGSWRNQPATNYTASVPVNAGEHVVRVEYYEAHSAAVARAMWELSAAAPEPNPAPEPTLPKGSFLASYYEGVFDELVTTRNESAINYDWGSGAPMNGMMEDNFSVRWEGRFDFEAADYTFSIETDDGMRVYVDDEIVVDSWKNQPATEYSATVPMSAGEHIVRVEYYESHAAAVARASWSIAGTDPDPLPEDPVVEPPSPPPSGDETYGARPVARSKTPSSSDVFVSPSGSGTSCTQSAPCSLSTGISRGGHVWMLSGTYRPSSTVGLSGITLESIDPNNKAIIDFGRADQNRLWLNDGNVIRNVIVQNSGHTGVYIRGSNNLVEGVTSQYNFGSGFQVFPTSQYADLTNPDGGSYNTFRDTIGRYNNDDCCAVECGAAVCSDSDSDGFSFSAGAHNVIEYSEAYGNTDDGFDIWRSYASTIRNSIAHSNGYDNGVVRGNGNGFKLGSSSGPNPNDHISSDNWAYGNAAYSFADNGGCGGTFINLVCFDDQVACTFDNGGFVWWGCEEPDLQIS